MFEAMLRQELGWFDGVTTGSLNSRLSSDATRIADVVSFNLNILARQTIQALGGVIYLFTIDAALAALSLGFMGLASLFADVYGRRSRKLAKRTQDALASAGHGRFDVSSTWGFGTHSVVQRNRSIVRERAER